MPPAKLTPEVVIQRRVTNCLRVVLAVQCVGMAARYLFVPFEQESDFFSTLVFDWEWPETLAQRYEDVGMWAMMVCGLALLVFPLVERILRYASSGPVPTLPARLWQPLPLLFITCWMLTIALFSMWRGGPYAEWVLGEWAARFAVPLTMLALLPTRAHPRIPERRMTDWMGILRFATAMTFIVHGWKALEHYPPFMDLVFGTFQRANLPEPQQVDVQAALTVIGVLDLLVAALIVMTRWPGVAFYMATWGFITAASRVTSAGWNAYAEMLLRAANGGVPLVLFLYWTGLRTLERKAASENEQANDWNTEGYEDGDEVHESERRVG